MYSVHRTKAASRVSLIPGFRTWGNASLEPARTRRTDAVTWETRLAAVLHWVETRGAAQGGTEWKISSHPSLPLDFRSPLPIISDFSLSVFQFQCS